MTNGDECSIRMQTRELIHVLAARSTVNYQTDAERDEVFRQLCSVLAVGPAFKQIGPAKQDWLCSCCHVPLPKGQPHWKCSGRFIVDGYVRRSKFDATLPLCDMCVDEVKKLVVSPTNATCPYCFELFNLYSKPSFADHISANHMDEAK